MKFWLILMIFDGHGEFIRKVETPTVGAGACHVEAGLQAMEYVNSGLTTQAWCVTDDHHAGRKRDEGIPYD